MIGPTLKDLLGAYASALGVARKDDKMSGNLPDWEDEDVQLVYNMLCNEELNTPPNPEEHWEGWVSRNIVAALRAKYKGVA